MLDVSSLGVMHAGYRLPLSTMTGLFAAARDGAVFDEAFLRTHESARFKLIAVTRFEDGNMMLRDGLHRATAVMRARPSKAIVQSEYVIEDMTYDMFLQPVFEAGLIAPFDPRTEVRVADWGDYRDEVRRRIREDDDALGYVDTHRHVYARPRQPHHDSLAQFYDAAWPYGEQLS